MNRDHRSRLWSRAAIEDEWLVGERIGDADCEVPGKQVIDHLADDFGPPALGQRRQLAFLEAAEVQSVGNQVAHVLSRADEAGSDLGAAADAAEGGAEKLSEQV